MYKRLKIVELHAALRSLIYKEICQLASPRSLVFFFRNSRLQREDLLSRHYRHSVEFHYLINDNSIHDFQIYW